MSKIANAFKKFSKTFWAANTMELFERWAWHGLFLVLALYLTKSKDAGALDFSQEQKGSIMGTVSAILYFLPVITGSGIFISATGIGLILYNRFLLKS